MDETEMRLAMMEFERKRAKLGLRAALPDDKKRRKTREPLTRHELHVLTFMRSQGVMDLETLAGSMDETKQEMLEQLMTLIDRGYVKVISERGYARYKARGKDEL